MKRLLMFVLLPVAFLAAPSDVVDAVMKGNKEAVRALLQRQANVNAAVGWHHSIALGRARRRSRYRHYADSGRCERFSR